MGEPKQARRQLRLRQKRGRVEMECRRSHADATLLHVNEGVGRLIELPGSIAMAIVSRHRSEHDLREAPGKGPSRGKRHQQLVPVGPPLLHGGVLVRVAPCQQARSQLRAIDPEDMVIDAQPLADRPRGANLTSCGQLTVVDRQRRAWRQPSGQAGRVKPTRMEQKARATAQAAHPCLPRGPGRPR